MSKWISVKEEMPDLGQEVLAAFVCWDDLIFQRTLGFDGEEWTDWNGELHSSVIAWQPLPSTDELELKQKVMKKIKYRLIESINNATSGNNKKYIIEKRKSFLWFSWWSQNYLFDVECCYESYDKDYMINMLSILRGEKNWIKKKVIK